MTLHIWFVIALFAALLLAASLQLLAASGHFPKTERASEFASGSGWVILHSTILLVLLAVIAGIWLVFSSAPWYAAVLAGGVGILAAPLILPNFSDAFVDGFPSLLLFTAGAYLTLIAMWMLR